MFKFLDFLSQSPDKVLDIATKGVDSVISAGDKLFYTDQEKAEAFQKRLEISQKLSEMHIKLIEATANENSSRSITRRIIAIGIMFFTFMLMSVIIGMAFINPEISKFALSVCVAFDLPYLMLITGIFFFGNHMINTYTGTKK